MHLSEQIVAEALENLKSVHPFFTLTFLVCKRDGLPVGTTKSYDINRIEKEFLDQYFKPVKNSAYYYRVSRVNRSQQWLKSDYPYKGSQKSRTEGKTGGALIHERDTDLWGWQENYIDILRSVLEGKDTVNLIPAFSLAVWLYREQDWSNHDFELVLEKFLREYNISDNEKRRLFDLRLPEDVESGFQNTPVVWTSLQSALGISPPPDLPPDTGGILDFLHLRGIGPSQELKIDFVKRVNLITGDNGLGKTFILDCAWWALSGEWTSGGPLVPRADAKKNEPYISFGISTGSTDSISQTAEYDWKRLDWPVPSERKTIPGLVVYARVDGAFAVWDPARIDSTLSQGYTRALILSRDAVWEGYSIKVGHGQTKFLCNGLIEDWVQWQNSQETGVFDTLKRVLKRLSPPEQGDLGLLEPDEPVRVPGWGTKLIPTIRHPYADKIPLTQASAAIRRITALAYLIVWAWEEHKAQSRLIREEPQNKLVILIDEIEAHLHPQWQRVILPALLDIREALKASIDVQFIITTHSPLVLASLEPYFNPEIDGAFHLNLIQTNLLEGIVTLDQPEFVFGTVDSWLRSDFFEMKHARNIAAEEAIEDAKKLQSQETVSEEDVRKVSERLLKYLGAHDSFWPRWTYFAEKHGVVL